MSALQDSLYGTDYGVALLSQEDTALHHTRSPKCSGSLLRGSLAITTTGLPPVSHQNLSRRTIGRLGGIRRQDPPVLQRVSQPANASHAAVPPTNTRVTYDQAMTYRPPHPLK